MFRYYKLNSFAHYLQHFNSLYSKTEFFMFKHKAVLVEFVNSSSINRGELDMMLTILIAVNQKYDTVVHVYINTKSSCWTKILNAEY